MNSKIILNLLFHAILGVLLRFILYNSRYRDYISTFLIFESAPYNYDYLEENYIYNLFYKTSELSTDNNDFANKYLYKNVTINIKDTNYYSKFEFFSKPIIKIYSKIRHIQKDKIFLFFVACDIFIGFLVFNLKNHLKINNLNNDSNTQNIGIFAFYMYNPISIINCCKLRLDIIYSLVQLLFSYNSDNLFLCPIFCFLTILISPSKLVLTLSYLIFLIVTKCKKAPFCLLITTGLIVLYINIGKLLNIESPLKSLCNLYNNYYNVEEKKPNFGLLWNLLPSTFLKYQNYTLFMSFIYRVTLCINVLFIISKVNDKDYNYKRSLAYSLLLPIIHIFDRYPNENSYIILLSLLLQHYEIIKVKILNLGVYVSFAGYTLIIFRGFDYYRRKSGSSNFIQPYNMTYDIGLIMIIMSSLTAINDYRKKCKEKTKELKNNEEKEEKSNINANIKEKIE